ncbi:hypothetical protein [Humidesulfovibrio sp.]
MNIDWVITKKRGNFRPVLQYTIKLSDFERELGMPMVRLQSYIPKPPEPSWEYCWPGQNERGEWTPAEFHQLATPAHKTGEAVDVLKLPWRENGEYPEVEASFQALREAFELVLEETTRSAPLRLCGCLETSTQTRRVIAPAFAAERLLRL